MKMLTASLTAVMLTACLSTPALSETLTQTQSFTLSATIPPIAELRASAVCGQNPQQSLQMAQGGQFGATKISEERRLLPDARTVIFQSVVVL